MPLDEEGAKWSCEPCIRGHRSSKCQHFDRMMMKVPKAGRPLAKCPHPKGSCSCQKLYAFMIRIPKGSTCLCRPVYQVPVEAGESAPSTSTTPVAPSPSPASGKIQKSSKKQIKLAPENLAKALDSIPEFGKHEVDNVPSFQPAPFPFQNISPEKPNDGLGSSQNIQMPRAPVAQTVHHDDTVKLEGGSCCSHKSQAPAPTPAPAPSQSACCKKPEIASSNGHMEQLGNAFQDSSYATNLGTSSYVPISTPHWPQFQPAAQSQFMQPALASQTLNGFSNYMPNYMTQPAPETSNNLSPHAVSGSMGYPTAMPQSFPNFIYPSPGEGDPSHDCHCGDNCQCLGCASHPFNNTTRQHVQEMGLLVALDGDDQNLKTFTGYQNGSAGSQPNTTSLEYPFANYDPSISQEPQSMPMRYAEHAASPTNVHNGYSSPPSEYTVPKQMMEPSQYYTLEYPVGLPAGCSDVTGSCQCGNDCTCIGCLTHSGHNGVALEPVSAAEGHSMTPVTGPVVSSADEPNQMHTVPSSASML
ncbi:hypothetical protein BDV59DRAFT_145681 [Aspergillus ambiguus]|uniref:putative copper-activated transcription factor GRISEA n=1 Tax=Aspergillus ambiguus TaxID=176160 RepID=UPI003CCCCFD5